MPHLSIDTFVKAESPVGAQQEVCKVKKCEIFLSWRVKITHSRLIQEKLDLKIDILAFKSANAFLQHI